ncbi:DUF72 domain-containing protein [Duffyella gerundensis]|jgi:uncharacterized protein YecE (DUF72 family)|uniref:DUF72 domain-containing protein n=1 Tax=Duffyella gerundensis TaxID=1619313 RepID=UPI0016A18308|nr:DUF72 domain-containing protein [Duffyella gerundensis]QTO55546.1 DUF72 domain-containing protein [Duffyella gerundensis]
MRIGLPQWQHPHWKKMGLETLADYARYFNCVEGNTTLYALPKGETVLRWRDMTDDAFRFCFKFPATITHQAGLRQCDELVDTFFRTLDPLAARIGQYWLQMPASFGPEHLSALWPFLDALPGCFSYGIEVRHAQFFAKGEAEQALNRGLHQRGVNRVILDSRPVHLSPSTSAASLDAKQKKPQVPVHAVRTATQPMVRFIGGDELDANEQLFQPWLKKLAAWQTEGEPWLFLHTPDIGEVLHLVQRLWPHLAQHLSLTLPPPDWPQQDALF